MALFRGERGADRRGRHRRRRERQLRGVRDDAAPQEARRSRSAAGQVKTGTGTYKRDPRSPKIT